MLEKANRKTLKEVTGRIDGSSDETKGLYMHGAIVYTIADIVLKACYCIISLTGILTIQMLEVFLIPKAHKLFILSR